MNTLNPSARLWLMSLVLFVLFIGVGCVPARLGVSWASLRLVDNNILVTYNERVLLIDSGTGRPIQLTDSTGRVRTGTDGTPLRWELNGQELHSQFFAAPILVDDSDEVALLVDYSGRIFNTNLSQACFSTPSGSCIVNNAPPFVAFEGRVSTEVASDMERLYLPLSEHDVLAINKASLTEEWRFSTQRGVWSAPLVINDVIYFAEMGHTFYAVEAETGNLVWQLDLGGAIGASPVFYDGTPATDYADDMPTPVDQTYDMANGRFYVGTFARSIVQVSVDGVLESVFTTNDWVWSSPKVVDGILYATDLGGWVYALDTTQDLRLIWEHDTQTRGIRARPLVTEEYVIVVSKDGVVVWLNRADGSIQLRQEVREETLSDLIYVPPTQSRPEGLIVLSTVNPNRLLFAFTIGGQQVWLYPPAS